MTGYVYAIQPDDLDLFKIGHTQDPTGRLKAFAAMTPNSVGFYRVLDVGSERRARVIEGFILSWLRPFLAYGEWAEGWERVAAAFAEIAPAVDVSSQYDRLQLRSRLQSRPTLSFDELERRLAEADDRDSYASRFRAMDRRISA